MRLLLSITLLLLLLAGAEAQTARAPAVSLKDLRGRALRLGDYRGKVVLLNFWATWCIPCRTEIPELVKLQEEYRGRGLQVIGITYPPQQPGEVRALVKKLKVNYPVALGTHQTKALFDEGDTLPLTVVIDREGVIREKIEGILLPEEFEQKIKPLLK